MTAADAACLETRLKTAYRIRTELEHIRDVTAACGVALAAEDADQVLSILQERQIYMSHIDTIQSEQASLLAMGGSDPGSDQALCEQEAENRRLLQDIVELDESIRRQADEWNETCCASLREIRNQRYIQAYEKEIEPSSLFLDIHG